MFNPDKNTFSSLSFILFINLLLILFSGYSFGQVSFTPSNIEVMKTLISQMADSLITKGNFQRSENVYIQLFSPQEYWIIEDAIYSSFKQKGYQVFNSFDETKLDGIKLKINNAEFKVAYGNVIRDGIFGSKKTERKITVTMSCQISHVKMGEILLSDSYKSEFMDTIKVNEIPNLETPSLSFTHAEYTGEDLIDKIVEPFIIIGASGAVVYLFFNVRSK